MKETYLKIFSNAKQLAGLGELTDLELDAINEEGETLAQALAQFGAPDGNPLAPTYVPPSGGIPGYACANPFPEDPAESYQPNAWRYPIDAENGLFGILDPTNSFTPCAGAAMS